MSGVGRRRDARDSAENQVRGAVIAGLAQVLTGQAIEFVDGVVQQSNSLPVRLKTA